MGQVIVGATVGAGAEFAQQMYDNGGEVDPLDCFIDCTVSAVFGALGGWFGGSGLVSPEGSVYKEGTRLLKIINNVDKGVYQTTGKALHRLSNVGKRYAAEYSKQAVTAATKYAVAAVATTAVKPTVQRSVKNRTGNSTGRLGYRSYSVAMVM